MQTQGTIRNKPQTLIIVWYNEHTDDERVESVQTLLPDWESVIKWAESQRDIPVYIRAE